MVSRTLGLQLVTAGATIALARLLAPADYGAFAIVQAAQYVGRNVVEVGLPSALVRRAESPTIHEERAVTGLMVAVGSALAAAAFLLAYAVLPPLGVDTKLADLLAIAFASLPLFALRAVPAVLLERRLAFGRLVVVEMSETLAFYAFAVPAAVSGLGAYSLAAALPVAAVAGVVAATALQPWARRLSFELGFLRPHIRFGLQVSAIWPVHMLRELTFVAVVAAVGGQALAGFYALSLRLFSITTAVLYAIQRVGFAAFSRSEPGAARAERAARASGLTAVAIGLPLAMVCGAADPVIGLVFGERWLPTSDVVQAAGIGVFLVTSAGGVLQAFLLSEGDARTPLMAASVQATVAVGLAAMLVFQFEAAGTGIAVAAGSIAFTAIVWIPSAESRAGLGPVARALMAALGAAVAGAAVGNAVNVSSLVAALGLTAATWVALSAVLSRSEVALLWSLIRREGASLRSFTMSRSRRATRRSSR
jgi:PST family polysaccharide transporter